MYVDCCSQQVIPVHLLAQLLVPKSCTSNFANLSCILVPDLSGTRTLDRVEHALLLPKFLVRDYSGTSNLNGELGSCAVRVRPIVHDPSYLSKLLVVESSDVKSLRPKWPCGQNFGLGLKHLASVWPCLKFGNFINFSGNNLKCC